MIEVIILVVSIVVVAVLLLIFSILLNTSNVVAGSYMKQTKRKKVSRRRDPLLNKFAKWYFTRKKAPFWTILIIDILIIVYSHLLGAYLTEGGETLVPKFWEYVAFSLCALPFFFIGMGLYRTFETAVRYSFAETLIRIMCSLVLGMLLTDLVKNLVPREWVIVWPQWREQVVTIICAIVLMCSVRLLLKMVFDTIGYSPDRKRVFIYGTDMTSIELGLALRRKPSSFYEVVGFIKSTDKSPNCSLQDTALLSNDSSLFENMRNAKVSGVMIPYSEYLNSKSLIDQLPDLMQQKIQVIIVP